MANERVASEDAVAGDIIGIHNHGQLQIGDTLTEGEALAFKGIPVLRAGALSRRAPARSVQGEAAVEGAAASWARKARSRCSRPSSATRCCWAPSARCSSRSSRIGSRREYKVDAIYETREHLDRALAHVSRRRPCGATSSASSAASLATDVDGNPVFLATEQVQPAGDDGALAEGRLSRDARARAADGARAGLPPDVTSARGVVRRRIVRRRVVRRRVVRRRIVGRRR